MQPTLNEADLLLVAYDLAPRRGDVVLVRLPKPFAGVLAVKRATLPIRQPDGPAAWWVERDNPREGVDSATVGEIPAHDVIAVVLARVWPHPRRLRHPAIGLREGLEGSLGRLVRAGTARVRRPR